MFIVLIVFMKVKSLPLESLMRIGISVIHIVSPQNILHTQVVKEIAE